MLLGKKIQKTNKTKFKKNRDKGKTKAPRQIVLPFSEARKR